MKTKIMDLIREKGSEVISVRSDNTIFEAIQVMVNHNIGAVLVVSEDGKLKGIFTERDILKECVKRSDQLKSTKVESVMTTDLIIGLPEDEVEYLMGVITENKIRHIPILSEGKISGMISIGDLVKSQLKDVEYENHYLRDYIMGKYPG
ncbi:MAG: CBS domain-containing protein [Candidatus Aminicenantes bacterium]|nr:CBS domain-containing protein [Candidatus Aminicenantes bacterium]MDH5705361.1 CBS domain-containing protein [Candidatus Aminicenantes bacterium]